MKDPKSKSHENFATFSSHRSLLLAQSYSLRFVLEQLKHLEQLATKWANELQDGWDRDISQWSNYQLMSMVRSLVTWRAETVECVRTDQHKCQQTWSEKQLVQYEPEPPMSWYTFGNPGREYLDERAESEF
jgi:hypothetical protein